MQLLLKKMLMKKKEADVGKKGKNMRMSIEDTKMYLYTQKSFALGKDYRALENALVIINKYQKIAKIVKGFDDMNSFDSMVQISEVIKHGMPIDNLCNSCTNIECKHVVVQPTVEARLKAEREKIAEDVAVKMNYMGSCLNEKNIILGVITGKRETTGDLCSICKSEDCISNGTAISKADYKKRLRVDLKTILEELQREIDDIVKQEEPIDNKWSTGLHYSEKIIQEKIDKIKEEMKKDEKK